MAKYLLGNGADPNIADYDGTTPLAMAAKKYSIDLVKLLLESGADPNVKAGYYPYRNHSLLTSFLYQG